MVFPPFCGIEFVVKKEILYLSRAVFSFAMFMLSTWLVDVVAAGGGASAVAQIVQINFHLEMCFHSEFHV